MDFLRSFRNSFNRLIKKILESKRMTIVPKIIRIATVPLSLDLLLTNQMKFMQIHGFEVLMVSADGPQRQKVIKREGCPHKVVPMTRSITPLKDLLCLWQLIRIFRFERPDIVHTTTPKAGLLGMIAAKLSGVKIRIHTVAGLPLMTTKGGKRQLLKWIEILTYASARYVWPNSRSNYDYILRHRFTTGGKLEIIGEGSSNGIDLDRWSLSALQQQKLEGAKSQIGYNPGFTYLLAIGRVVRDKGIIELINAFETIYRQDAKNRLLLVGPLERERREETLPQGVVDKIDSHPGINHIQWTDEPEYLLALADLFIHASHREGFPNVVLQAGAMKCPIVCSDIPGNIDIVAHEQTGLHFRVGDDQHLIQQIMYALANSNKMQVMAEKLRGIIEVHYSREIIHNALYEKYWQLLEEAGFEK